MSQGFMTAVELATYYVLEDPASLVPAEGYVVALVVFYEGVQCAIALIHRFTTAVLQTRAAQSDPLEDLAHHGLCDSV
jgi:hypothetical protein